MQFTTIILSALASTALAAPVSMMAAVGEWTIEGLSRATNADDTSSVWTFGIHPAGQAATACTLTVTGTPSSQANGGPATCGAYTVTSGWSGQFGAGNGFTTLSVVDYAAKYIIYPAYTDAQVSSGKVVTPDQSYAPAVLA